jgi:hypothetical protein
VAAVDTHHAPAHGLVEQDVRRHAQGVVARLFGLDEALRFLKVAERQHGLPGGLPRPP